MSNGGIIGTDYDELKNRVYNDYKDIFNLYEKLNTFLNTKRNKFDVDRYDYRGVVIVALFSKSLYTFQAIYILFRNCLPSDGASLVRNFFEESLLISLCCKGEEEFLKYMGMEIHKKITLINIMKQYPNDFPGVSSRMSSLDEMKEKWKNKLDEMGNPEKIKTIEQLANEVGAMGLYQTFYRSSSNEVHTNPYILDNYLNFNGDADLESFASEPRIEISSKYLLTSIEFMIFICRFISDYFGIIAESEINEVDEQFKTLHKKYLEN